MTQGSEEVAMDIWTVLGLTCIGALIIGVAAIVISVALSLVRGSRGRQSNPWDRQGMRSRGVNSLVRPNGAGNLNNPANPNSPLNPNNPANPQRLWRRSFNNPANPNSPLNPINRHRH
jgi:hypothetical protein